MKVQRLDISYLEQMIDIRKRNPSDINDRPMANPTYAQHYLENQYLLLSNSYYRAYGVVDDSGKLWCYGLQKYLTSQRAWVLVLVISDQTEPNGKPMNGLGLVLDKMIEEAELLRYYQYYTVTPYDRANQHDKVWSRISRKKGHRYVSCLEEILPPRCVSAFGVYWDDVLAGILFDHKVAIRHVFLSPQHRDFGELGQ